MQLVGMSGPRHDEEQGKGNATVYLEVRVVKQDLHTEKLTLEPGELIRGQKHR